MALWDFVKKHAGLQFLEIIEWLDDTDNTLLWRFPVMQRKITSNSKLVVREGQEAIFVSEGQLSGVFKPGTHALNTRNKPILAFFTTIAYKFNYPYKGDVVFVSTRQFTDNGWGTPNPIMMRDPEFGPVRIRANGIFSYRVTDAAVFLRELVGTDGEYAIEDINGQLKGKLVSALADTLAESNIPVLDFASQYNELSEKLKTTMSPIFAKAYGLSLTDFTIQTITLPESVEEALDTKTKMGVLGNLDDYTKMQIAESIPIAAENQGLAGAGMGMGVGVGVGHAVVSQMAGAAMGSSPAATPAALSSPPPVPEASYHYHGPTGKTEKSLAELVGAILADPDARHLVWQAGWAEWKPATDVPEIKAEVVKHSPPPVPPEAP